MSTDLLSFEHPSVLLFCFKAICPKTCFPRNYLKPRCWKPSWHYLCTPQPGRLGCVISIQKGLNGYAYPVAISQKVTKNLPASFFITSEFNIRVYWQFRLLQLIQKETSTKIIIFNRNKLTIWTICAFRVLNPRQWSLAKQCNFKSWKVMTKRRQNKLKPKGMVK